VYLYARFFSDLYGWEYNADSCYARTIGEQYWSGYRSQKFVLFDDIWQRDDKQIKAQTVTEFMACSGDNPYSLPMADVESKGETYFTSPMIFLTANPNGIPERDQIGIQNKQAFARRIDCYIWVNAVGHSGDGAFIDYGKKLSTQRYEFFIGDPISGRFEDKARDFVDIACYIHQKRMEKMGQDKSVIATLMSEPNFFDKEKQAFSAKFASIAHINLPSEPQVQGNHADWKKLIETPRAQCGEKNCPHKMD
jgi:hypothetical protein